MQLVPLGSTGLQVSRFCLGSMQFGWTADERESFAVLDAFVAAGGNFIDTADIYSRWVPGNSGGDAERIIGRWMKARGNRDSLIIATKVRGAMWDGPDGEGLTRGHILRAAKESLERLQTDRIDLYQCHWFDATVLIEETLRAFTELIKAGKVRYIGASNYPVALLQEAAESARDNSIARFETLQPHHSLVHRKEYEVGPQQFCIEHNLGVIPYSPLAAGFLTGKYAKGGERVRSQRAGAVKQYFTAAGWSTLDAVRDVASAHRVEPAAVALAWQVVQPGITAPIIGANSPAQLADQLPALQLTLADAEIEQLNAASQPFLANGDSHPGR